MEIQCYKCKKKMKCNPKGECWCKNLNYKIPKKKINENEGCLCEICIKEKFKELR